MFLSISKIIMTAKLLDSIVMLRFDKTKGIQEEFVVQKKKNTENLGC